MADETKVRWWHGETGRVRELSRNEHPGKGWSPLSAHGWWDVRDMAAAWLADHGYDGLVNEDTCGCTLEDLSPCGDMQSDCIAAYRHPGRGGFDFLMMPTPHTGDGCRCGAETGDDDE